MATVTLMFDNDYFRDFTIKGPEDGKYTVSREIQLVHGQVVDLPREVYAIFPGLKPKIVTCLFTATNERVIFTNAYADFVRADRAIDKIYFDQHTGKPGSVSPDGTTAAVVFSFQNAPPLNGYYSATYLVSAEYELR